MIFSDGKRRIEIENGLIQCMQQYRQTNALSPEAGGVIFGRELIDTDNLIINNMTEPYEHDKRSRFSFRRKDIGHIDYYKRIYDESGGIIKYVGEWHTHPEKIPNYSFLDKREWMKILKKKPAIAPLYFIIIGIEVWRIWKVAAFNKLPELLYEEAINI